MITLRQLGPGELRRMIEQTRQDDDAAGRKAAAANRLRVDAQQHLELLRLHATRFYDSAEIRTEILRHVDVLKNLLRMVCNQVAVAYDRPPARRLRGVDAEQEREFLAAYREASTDVEASQWNRFAFYLGVVHILPRIEHGKLVWVTVTPDTADVLFDPAGEREPSILVYESKCHGSKYVAVDAERWQWIDKDWKLITEETHGLGMVPWVTFRWQPPPRGDYWDRAAGQDLYDGTMEIGRVYAQARWVRKHNSKRLTHIHTGQNVDVPANQNMSSTQPVHTHGDGAATIASHDMVVPVGEFIAEMREITESVLEAYGLPSSIVDVSDTASNTPANGQAALDKIRNKSIRSFDASELQLAIRVAALLRGAGRLRLSETEVRESFRCRFALMTWADHPRDRMETAKAKIELGQTDPYELYCEENPGVTYAEAVEYVDGHVEARAKFYEVFKAHNLSLDPSDDMKTAAQMNGKIGGMTPADDDESSESEAS